MPDLYACASLFNGSSNGDVSIFRYPCDVILTENGSTCGVSTNIIQLKWILRFWQENSNLYLKSYTILHTRVPYILDFWKTGMINPLTYIRDKVQDVKTLIQNVNQCS